MSVDIAFVNVSSEVHLDTLAMQWYSRAIVCKELAQGSYTVTVLDMARTHTGRAL